MAYERMRFEDQFSYEHDCEVSEFEKTMRLDGLTKTIEFMLIDLEFCLKKIRYFEGFPGD